MLTLKIVRVEGGVQATFGGRGLTPDDIAAMTRAIAAEMLSGRFTPKKDQRDEPRPGVDPLIRFAVESGDSDEIAVTSHQTRTTVRLPLFDVPLVIAALQNLCRSRSRSESTSRDPSS
jgi:hypothetical protein